MEEAALEELMEGLGSKPGSMEDLYALPPSPGTHS